MANIVGKNPIVIDTPNQTTPQITRTIWAKSMYIAVQTKTSYRAAIHDQNGTVVWSGMLIYPTGGTAHAVLQFPARLNGLWIKSTTSGGLIDRTAAQSGATTITKLYIYEH